MDYIKFTNDFKEFTDWDFKNSVNDKLINYTIEIEYSNNMINNIT